MNSTFSIQGRFTTASTSGVGATASVSSGLVIRETGASRIQISFDSKNANTVQGCRSLVKLYENGSLKPLVSASNFTKVSISVLNNEEIFIMYESKLEIHLFVRSSDTWGCFFTHWLGLPNNYRANETLIGLMGNANGNPYDDWQTKLGVTLPTPTSNAALFQGGYDYCRTEWCLRTVSESLFTYSSNESFARYFECDTPYNAGLENAIKNASPALVQVCGSNEECLIDGTTGTMKDAQNYVAESIVLESILKEWNITYNFNETAAPNRSPTTTTTTAAPNSSPTTSSTTAPSQEQQPCGLFRLGIFCPLTFQGIFGRFIRKLFGL